jgi:hypothetical protein
VARGFRRTRHGLRAKLDVQERAVLAHLFVEVYELLDDGTPAETDPLAAMIGIGTAVDLPDDPALARLLPDAHKEDHEASSDFRRYTEQGLRERKRRSLETARLTLGRDGALTLDEPEAQAWLVALTDVRLVLAERMGLRTEDDHEVLMRQLGIPLDGDLEHGDHEHGDLEHGDHDAGDLQDGDLEDRDVEAGDSEDVGRADREDRGLDGEPGFDVPAGHPAAGRPTSHDELDDAARAQLATMLSLYDFLTWLQETLVQAVCDD